MCFYYKYKVTANRHTDTMSSFMDKKSIVRATRAQNIALKNRIDATKNNVNVESQKYHYMSGTRIYAGYVSYLFKVLYMVLFLMLLIALMFSDKGGSFYVKLGIAIGMFLYPLFIGQTYPWFAAAWVWIKATMGGGGGGGAGK